MRINESVYTLSQPLESRPLENELVVNGIDITPVKAVVIRSEQKECYKYKF